jgi:4-amino-4-deoxy-L-arabinose transferase-like glycosyltransferase
VKLMAMVGLLVSISACATGIASGDLSGAFTSVVAAMVTFVLIIFLAAPAPPQPYGSHALQERAFLGKVVVWSLVLRIVVASVLHMGNLWASVGGDEGTYFSNAKLMTLWLRNDVSFRYTFKYRDTHEVGYLYLLVSLFYTFGVTKVLPLLVNAVLGACIVYPVHSLAGRWFGRPAARSAALFAAFFPSLILWSGLMVRDIPMLFFLVASLWCADDLRRKLRLPSFVGLLACIACMASLRTYIAWIVVASIVASMFLSRRSATQSVLIGGTVLVIVVLAFRNTGVGESDLGRANLEFIAQMRRYNAMGPSQHGSLGTDVDISTPSAALTYLPVGLAYFYLSPLPWQIGSPRQVLAILDLLVWYPMLYHGCGAVVWLLRRRPRAALPLALTVVGISVLYALVEGNIGIIFRHRGQIVVPFCVLAGVGYALRRRAAAKEAKARGSAVPLDLAARGAVGPAPGL